MLLLHWSWRYGYGSGSRDFLFEGCTSLGNVIPTKPWCILRNIVGCWSSLCCSRELHPRLLFIISVTWLNLGWLLKTNLAAWCWISSILSEFRFLWGFHAQLAYSNFGQTRVLYASALTWRVHPPNILLAQQAVEKYLAQWTLDMAWPFKE